MRALSARACRWCAAPFAVPANNPHRRFCSPRCRVADWHFRHDRPPGAGPDAAGPNAVPDASAVPVPSAVADSTGAGAGRCPHCRRPVAVLSVLVPPAAAVVAVPPAPDHGHGDSADA